MPSFIEDFIQCGKCEHCSGFFKGDEEAMRFSRQITKSQVRKYRRYARIPCAFVKYLGEIKVIDQDQNTDGLRTVLDVLDILWVNKDKTTKWPLVQFMREQLLAEISPGHRGASCSQYPVWKNLINSKFQKKGGGQKKE
jgi:hypothetical protein